VEALQQAQNGPLQGQPQPEEGVSYAHKVEKHEAQIDWQLPATAILRRIRAFDPFPGASSRIAGEVVKCWGAALDAGAPVAGAAPGTLLQVAPEGISVATGESVLRLTTLQRPGGKRLPAADFLRG